MPNLMQFVIWTNNYLFPVSLLIIPVAAFIWRGRAPRPEHPGGINPYPILIGVPLGAVLLWLFLTLFFFRYLLIFIPLTSILLALCILWLWDLRHVAVRILAVVVTLLLIATNFVHAVPLNLFGDSAIKGLWSVATSHYPSPQYDRYVDVIETLQRRRHFEWPFLFRDRPVSMLTCYGAELVSDYKGPIGCIVEYLKKNANPGDKVWIRYGDIPLLFYTDCKVVSWYRAALEPDSYKGARWIIPRHGDEYRNPNRLEITSYIKGRFYRAGSAIGTPDFERTIREDYDLISFNVADLAWEERPDPDIHMFITAPLRPPYVEIYRRKDTVPPAAKISIGQEPLSN